MNKFSADDLKRLYIVEQKPMHQIAKELQVSIGTVFNYLKKYEIETRSKEDTFTMKGRKLSEVQCKMLSDRAKGRKASDETKKKMSDSLKHGGIGHKKQRTDGYVAIYFPDHPRSTADGYIMEHVLVMECLLGRHLLSDEVVHHINRKKNDNRKENLQLMTLKEHAALHMREKRKVE